ncbi:MAG: hypothetical protein RBT70_09890 [Alphaproteobacteria bacterium]|jgi:hypothetical protein|nr:hypothetical protein [Alphaproteobacteria bacterium]
MNKKKQAGRRGGMTTLARHGRDHFSRIGKRGAAAFWKAYRLQPYGIGDYAVVKIANGAIVALLSGRRVN